MKIRALSLGISAALAAASALSSAPPAKPSDDAAAKHVAEALAAPKTAPKGAKPAAPAAGGENFIESVDVTVVNVDVFVTDKQGKRVTGLNREDFELSEDGKPVKITNFYAVEVGRPTAGLPAAAEETLPGQPPPERKGGPPPVPEDQRLRLIVYLDNFNIHPFNRNRVLKELRGFLHDHVGREDRVMLVTYDRELHIRSGFTSDPDLVSGLLSDQEKVTGSAVHADSDRKLVLDRVNESSSPDEALSFARGYAESVFNDLTFTIDAMKKMVDSMAGMPGRKAILYVSDGIPLIAGQDMFYAVQNKYTTGSGALNEMIEFDSSRRLRELTAKANSNRVTFYTIDAGGLRTYESVSAENQTNDQGIYLDSIRISNLQAPLQTLAEDTGGVAIINANRVLPDLQRIAADFGTFYSLGYSPVHAGDGRYHKIDVKVKRKGLLIRHREGYRDKSPETQMNDSTLAVLQFPFEQNPLAINLEFGHGTEREDGYFVVPVQVKIPLGRVTLIPRDKTQEASLRLFFAAMDADGNTSEVQQARVPISIPNVDVAKAKGKYYVYTVSLLMRPGDSRVAVGLRDEAAASSSFLARGVHVGS
jgi:VWFA-related protein